MISRNDISPEWVALVRKNALFDELRAALIGYLKADEVDFADDTAHPDSPLGKALAIIAKTGGRP